GSAIAVPIAQAVHRIAHRETGGPVTERGHDAGHLVAGNRRATIMPRPIDPRRRPVELRRREARGVHTHERVAYAGRRDWRFLLDKMFGATRLVNSQCTHSQTSGATGDPCQQCFRAALGELEAAISVPRSLHGLITVR